MIARLRTVYHPDFGRMVAIVSPYLPTFVEDIKYQMPYPDRVWDQQRKIWLVVPKLQQFAETILRRHYSQVVWDDRICQDLPSEEPPPPPPTEDPRINRDRAFRRGAASEEDWKILQLHPGACREVAVAAYRALSAKYHPDRGGDETTMQLVNAAWGRIKRLFEEVS